MMAEVQERRVMSKTAAEWRRLKIFFMSQQGMAPDVKSMSWQRSDNPRSSSLHGSTRRRLSDVFDKEKKPQRTVAKTSPLREMRQFSLSKIRMPRASPTRRALRSGADKIVRTFQQLRLSVDTISQVCIS